jgi:hypothetical protein
MLPGDDGGSGLFLSPVPVPAGDPAAVSGAAATYTAAHGEMDRSRATLVAAVGQAGGVVWTGAGATACVSAAGRLASAYAITAGALARGATALRAYSTSLATAQQTAHRANQAVAAVNATASLLITAQAAAQQAQDTAADASQASTAADLQAASAPHSPLAQLAAQNARTTASDAGSAASAAVTRMNTLSAQYDTERSAALTLCGQATEQASQATTHAVTALDGVATELVGPPARPARPVSHSGGGSFWSGLLHGAEHLGEDAVNGMASLGSAMAHDPGGVFAMLGGIGLATVSSGGEVVGTVLDATGIGAVAGVPLNVASAAGIAGGLTLAGAGGTSIARDALGQDRVTLMQSSSDGGATGGGAEPPVQVGSPREFDPQSLEGLSSDQVRESIPSDWVRSASARGGGEVFRDPANPGRQIRIMPGYPEGSRPDPLTTGPYAVVSQNGVTVKIPLEGNPTLP